jgi:hypothetical protein
VVDTVFFSLRLDIGAQPRTHGRPPTLASLIQGEQADAIRSSIVGLLPSSTYSPADVLLDVDGDVLTVHVAIPLTPPTAGRTLLATLRRLAAGSLSPLGGSQVVEIVTPAEFESRVFSPDATRQRADARQRRECLSHGPDIAAALVQGEAAEKPIQPPADATPAPAEQGHGTTAALLLVGSTTLAVLVASAHPIALWLNHVRARSDAFESMALVHDPKPSGRPKTVFVSLNGARIIASIHIVFGHLYQSGYGGSYASSWGFAWVPFFFMLSGYVLTLARLASRTPEAPQSVVSFVQKRAAVIYPPFAVTLFLGLAQRRWEGEALPQFYHLAAQSVLAQSFVPWLPEDTIQVRHGPPGTELKREFSRELDRPAPVPDCRSRTSRC